MIVCLLLIKTLWYYFVNLEWSLLKFGSVSF